MTSMPNLKPPLTREELEAHWMPYTGNRQFKDDPRMLVSADGIYYIDDRGRRVMEGLSGLWCCGAGHNRSQSTRRAVRVSQTRRLRRF